MTSALVGLVLGFGIIIVSIFLITDDRMIFIDIAGASIVIGGTVASSLIMYTFEKLKELFKVSLTVLKKPIDDTQELAVEIMEFLKETSAQRRLMGDKLDSIKDPFFRESMEMIVEKVDADSMESLLNDRIAVIKLRHDSYINMLKTIGKIPPVFGMTGTVIGLVALLQGLGGDLGVKNLGPAMAVGLITTLYGLLLPNLTFIPMAENLAYKSKIDMRKRKLTLAAAVLVAEGESLLMIQESINSMLPVEIRMDVMGVNEGKAAA